MGGLWERGAWSPVHSPLYFYGAASRLGNIGGGQGRQRHSGEMCGLLLWDFSMHVCICRSILLCKHPARSGCLVRGTRGTRHVGAHACTKRSIRTESLDLWGFSWVAGATANFGSAAQFWVSRFLNLYVHTTSGRSAGCHVQKAGQMQRDGLRACVYLRRAALCSRANGTGSKTILD